MTRNYDAYNENPLYTKLRKKFSYDGKTIADVVTMRAMRDGYNPRINYSVSANAKPERRTTSEISIKRANSIMEEGNTEIYSTAKTPRSSIKEEAATMIIGTKIKAPAKKAKAGERRRPINLGFAAVLMLCFGLLMYLVFAGMQINELNQQISSLKDSNALLEADRTYYEDQLSKKNDMDTILNIATEELGMVKQSEVSHVVIGSENGDIVEVYDTSDDSSTFISNLLNAFTESFGK